MRQLFVVSLVLVLVAGALFAGGEQEAKGAVYGLSLSTLNNPFFVYPQRRCGKQSGGVGNYSGHYGFPGRFG